jgi:cytochrome P450
VLADPIHAFDGMRRSCPVAHSDYLGWSVFRHADVVAIADDHASYSSKVSVAHPALPNGFDPPQHDRYRALVDRYFTREEVARCGPPFTAIAQELARSVVGRGKVEFIGRVALPFALRAQRAWLNWPAYLEEALAEWMARNHRATLRGDRDQLDEVARDFDRAVRRVIAERRAQPADEADDITTRLLHERVDARPLGEDEVVSILRNWTVGELGTVAASIGIVVGYLAAHGGLQAQLRAAPHELPDAIDEILRIDGPLLSNRRVTTSAVELGGRSIEAGERVTILWASANRDEEVFGDPDDYRPHENAPHNVLYGRGIHDCPGAPLARLELRVVVGQLLEQTSSIRLAPGATAERAVSPATGYRTLRLLLEP